MYSDAVIAYRVREAILLNPRISAQDIIVTSDNRVVELAGDVDLPEQVAEAELTASAVEGVEYVVNALRVRPGRWPPVKPEILPWMKGR